MSLAPSARGGIHATFLSNGWDQPDAVEEEEWEPAGDEAAHDEAEDERRPPLLLARHALPLPLALLRRRRRRRRSRRRRPRRRLTALAAPAALEPVHLRRRLEILIGKR